MRAMAGATTLAELASALRCPAEEASVISELPNPNIILGDTNPSRAFGEKSRNRRLATPAGTGQQKDIGHGLSWKLAAIAPRALDREALSFSRRPQTSSNRMARMVLDPSRGWCHTIRRSQCLAACLRIAASGV